MEFKQSTYEGGKTMTKCIECGDKTRNGRSCLCQDCFDKALREK